MPTRHKIILAAVTALCFFAWVMPSAAQPCLARQLMTPNEWRQHQAAMHRLPPAAREVYRATQHEEMRRRAAALGLGVPGYPPPMGMGAGRAMRPGIWGLGYGPRWYPYGGWARPGWGRGPRGPWHRRLRW